MEKLLTVKEVAELLKIDVTTVYKWAEQGRLSYVDLGREGGNRCLRFMESDLKEIIAERRVVQG